MKVLRKEQQMGVFLFNGSKLRCFTDDEVSDHEQLPGNREEFNDGNTTANVPMDFLDWENSSGQSSERLDEKYSVIWV